MKMTTNLRAMSWMMAILLITACKAPPPAKPNVAIALAAELGATPANIFVEEDDCRVEGCNYMIYFYTTHKSLDTATVKRAMEKTKAGGFIRYRGTSNESGLGHIKYLNRSNENLVIQKAAEPTPSNVVITEQWAAQEMSTTLPYLAQVEIYYMSKEANTYLWMGKPITQNVIMVSARH